MGLLELITGEIPEEDIVLQGNPQARALENLAPILAKPNAADYYLMERRNLDFSPKAVAGTSGTSKLMHRQFHSPVTGDNFGKQGSGEIASDKNFDSSLYEPLGLLGALRFDADAVNNARKALEQRPEANEYRLFGNNCIDFSMDMLDEMMRQKTGEGLGWR